MNHASHPIGQPFDTAALQAVTQFVVARLSEAESEIDRDCTERLRAAREQALARRKVSALPEHLPVAVPLVAADLALAGGQGASVPAIEGLGLWTRLASLLPLVALVAGLWTIQAIQNHHRAAELADVDAALLTDDLPPSAYADPGFLAFLHAGDAFPPVSVPAKD